jgi:hypothetical protein
MSASESHWRWIRGTWLSWAQAESYSGLPRHILRELAYQRRIKVQSLFSRVGRQARINRYSIDKLFCNATQSGEPIYWRRLLH